MSSFIETLALSYRCSYKSYYRLYKIKMSYNNKEIFYTAGLLDIITIRIEICFFSYSV